MALILWWSSIFYSMCGPKDLTGDHEQKSSVHILCAIKAIFQGVPSTSWMVLGSAKIQK